jgi:LPS-assembly protein
MKNKIIIIFLVLVFKLSSLSIANSDEFTFSVTDLEILENNTVYKGNNRGKVITDSQVELVSDNFIYLKKINRLETNGDVQLTDTKSNVIINAEKMFYLKSEEIIYTVGKTLINVDDQYNIEGYDLTFLKNKMILFSNKKSSIIDINSNVYKLAQFEYSINEEILKGEKIFYRRNEKENKEDEYYLETGFFNLKTNEFLGKDINMTFHKTLFDDEKNDPRLNAATTYGNEYNTYLEKAVFTSCKKTDKCPPWKMRAKKMRHDKIKKQIIYKNAWLELYDFPVAYFPKFFHPDPTVKRQSGLLRPAIGDHQTLGNSIYLPYFFVISDDKDITLKPRLFNDNKLILQTEYRQKTENSLTIIDSSITTGHNSSEQDKGDSRSHFFVNTKIDLNLDKFINSNLEINIEKVSNDNYLKLFDFVESPLLIERPSVLETLISMDLTHEDYNLIASFEMYETLSGSTSDRYQYILPTYNFSKNFDLGLKNGSFLFNSSGNNTLSNTNVTTSKVINSLNFSSTDTFFNNGIAKKYEILTKNTNSIGKNSTLYKNSPQSELMSSYIYSLSMPLEKKNKEGNSTIVPKLSFKYSPHDMKNHSSASRRINVDNIFSSNRLGLGDSFETGESLTLGLDFIKEKINTIDGITEIEDYFDFKLATVLRFKEEKNIPINSTLNKKTSNIFGQINFKPNKIVSLNYDFSLTNDLNTFEYNSITSKLTFNNLSTEFTFFEETGLLGNSNAIGNTTEYQFNEYNSLSFGTRRNRELNLTEFYDLIYEYKNDCLIAEIKYRKDYYNDADIIPKEELFFSITIVPFYTYSPDKMILNKDRVD